MELAASGQNHHMWLKGCLRLFSDFVFFGGKKPKIFKYSNAAFSATFGRIDFGIGAFESLWSIFFISEKILTCPHFPLIFVAFEEGLRTKNAKNCDFRPSSNSTEIKGKWGRTIFLFFLKVSIKTFQTHLLSCLDDTQIDF